MSPGVASVASVSTSTMSSTSSAHVGSLALLAILVFWINHFLVGVVFIVVVATGGGRGEHISLLAVNYV